MLQKKQYMKYVTIEASGMLSAIIMPENVNHIDAISHPVRALSAGFCYFGDGKVIVDRTRKSTSLKIGPLPTDEDTIHTTLLLSGLVGSTPLLLFNTEFDNIHFIIKRAVDIVTDNHNARSQVFLLLNYVRSEIEHGECFCCDVGVASKQQCGFCEGQELIKTIEEMGRPK